MSMQQVYEVFPKCPKCGDRRVGKIGVKMYFCQECAAEFKQKGGSLVIVDYYKEEKKEKKKVK